MKHFLSAKITGGRTRAIVPVFLALLIILPFMGTAQADTFTQTLSNVEFNAVPTDPTGAKSYDLDFSEISFASMDTYLLYNSGSGWNNIPLTFISNTDAYSGTLTLSGLQSISLEIAGDSNGTRPLTAGTMTFSGPAGSNLYNNLMVSWSGGGAFNLSSVTPSGTAHVSPVPIPAPAILLGSGLLGLIGLGVRKRTQA